MLCPNRRVESWPASRRKGTFRASDFSVTASTPTRDCCRRVEGMTRRWCPPLIAAGAALVVLAWGECEHWRSSHRRVDAHRAETPGSEAVVVLGFRNRGDRANAVNRWRVRAGVRSQQPHLGPTRLVLCGGPSGGSVSESELMADYLKGSLAYRGAVQQEVESRSTWENIQNAIPLIEDADRIKIISHALHAEKGRAYLAQCRPDLAAKLVRGDEYRLGEWVFAKPLLAVIGRHNLRRIDQTS